jgi:hypothetical protein
MQTAFNANVVKVIRLARPVQLSCSYPKEKSIKSGLFTVYLRAVE